MGDVRTNFSLVEDGQVLVRLPSGIELVRRRKHEPRSFQGATLEQIRKQTDKKNGSKFAASWALDHYVEWLTRFLSCVDWTFPPSLNFRVRIPLLEEVGIAAGERSHTIEIVARGRIVHAYPI